MKTIVLISCASKELPHRTRAADLYVSPLFKLSLEYGRSLCPDAIYVVSAKHGLLSLDQEIRPYDSTLNDMSEREVKEWSEKVIRQMGEEFDLDRDRVVFLAGRRYRKYLCPRIGNCEIPMEGLGIGRQLQFLKEEIRKRRHRRVRCLKDPSANLAELGVSDIQARASGNRCLAHSWADIGGVDASRVRERASRVPEREGSRAREMSSPDRTDTGGTYLSHGRSQQGARSWRHADVHGRARNAGHRAPPRRSQHL